MKRALSIAVIIICGTWLCAERYGVEWTRVSSILNPRTTTKLWTVEGFTKNYGHFRSYWTKNAALARGEEFKQEYPLVRLTNELTGKWVDLKDEYQKYLDEQAKRPEVIIPWNNWSSGTTTYAPEFSRPKPRPVYPWQDEERKVPL